MQRVSLLNMPTRILCSALIATFAAGCAPRVAPAPQPPRHESGWQSPQPHAAQPPLRTGLHPKLFEPAPTPIVAMQPEAIEESIAEPSEAAAPEFEENERPDAIAALAAQPADAPPNWRTESLAPRIASAAAPNVAAALRLVERGRQLLEDGNRDGALDALESALAIDPSNAFGYYYLARLYFERRSHNQALGFASRATILADAADAAWVGRTYALQGTIFEQVARYAEAREAYRRALEADPRNVAARVGLNRLGRDGTPLAP